MKRALHGLYWTCLLFMAFFWVGSIVDHAHFTIPFWVSMAAFYVTGVALWKLNAWSLA